MLVRIEGEQRILVRMTSPGLEIEAAEDHLDFSPLHMLAASLATCTASVLAGWAMRADLHIHDLELDLSWEYVDDPYRVGRYDLTIRWPSLPPSRRDAAARAARHCTVENTLRVSPVVEVEVEGPGT